MKQMNMRKIVATAFTVTAALAIAASAQAADLQAARPAYKAPTYVRAMPYNWAGFYVGGNVGSGWATASADLTGPAGLTSNSASENLNGGIFGAQAGYNWQFGQWVVGLETVQDLRRRPAGRQPARRRAVASP